MSKIDVEELEERPLDPELEKVRRKMMRLLVVSIGIMMIGLMAVLAAVVYKATRGEPAGPSAAATAPAGTGDVAPSDRPFSVRAALPAGFSVQAVALDGGRVLFFGIEPDGVRRAIIVDAASGRTIGELLIDDR